MYDLQLAAVKRASLAPLVGGCAMGFTVAEPLDWPEFRRPNRRGIAPEGCEPPVAWSETVNIAASSARPI